MLSPQPFLLPPTPACPRAPQATHEDYANKLYAAPSVKDSKRFSKPKLSRTDFTIDHYAGRQQSSMDMPRGELNGQG